MKNLKFIPGFVVCALIILMNSNIACAQKSHFSISYSPVIPFSLKNNAKTGLFGADLGYSYDLTSKITWCLHLAYNKFGKKTPTTFSGYKIESKLAFIPVTTGLQIFFKDEGARGYFLFKGGYYLPAADFKEGGAGLSPGLGIVLPTKDLYTKFDISLTYNAVFGVKTKAYKVHEGEISGGITTQNIYNCATYLALNIGLVFGK